MNGLKRGATEANLTPPVHPPKTMKSSNSESELSFDTTPAKRVAAAVPGSMFSQQALPLHVNLTHTPPKLPDEGEVVVPNDPGHLGTLTLVPSVFVTGGYGWKGSRTVQVELLDVEKGEERKQVDVILSVNAVVVDNKDATDTIAGDKDATTLPSGAVSEADGGMEGYESDEDTTANDSIE